MDWLDRMNHAMDYIEENLDAEISYDTIARIAICSTFCFQRMFSFITGVPLSEYIRRRRLTLAAFELQTSDVKIIDVALKYGYESAGAFGRAFKNLYGMLPSTLRAVGAALTAYPKMTFTLSIKGGTGMDYRIEQKEAFEIFGVYKEVGMDMEQTFLDVSEFEKNGVADGTWDRINAILGRPEGSWLLAAIYDNGETTHKYLIGYYLPRGLEIPKTYTRLSVPARTWAVFPTLEESTHSIWRRVYSEWFPTSKYEQDEGAVIEVFYGSGWENVTYDHGEVWIPVKLR